MIVHTTYNQLGEAAKEHASKCPQCQSTNCLPMCPIGSLLAMVDLQCGTRTPKAGDDSNQQSFPA